ncbi:PiggyBac transposable element-derived protein 4 [Anthophora retusa]
MAKQQDRQRTTVRNTVFESDDSVCLSDIEEEFQRTCASGIESSEDSDNVVTFRPSRRINRICDTSESNNEMDQNSDWQNVTENDTYSGYIAFSTGDKVQGPQVPTDCITPLQFFSLFFTDELISKITTETNLYAQQIISGREVSTHSLWQNWYEVTAVEMKAFLGVIINMGLMPVHDIKDYWSKKFNAYIPFYNNIFRRQRFLQIFWALHLETTPQTGNRERISVNKVAHLLNYLDQKFRQHFVPAQNIAVDESTVGFKGRVSFKTYNPKKPNKWGLRLYVLADSLTGYVYTFLPYFGKQTTNALIDPDLPITSRIVLHLYNNLQQSIPGAQGYHIYTDRLYTSIILGERLLKLQCHLTGTIMTNRKGIPLSMKSPKLRIGETVAYRKEETLLLAWRDKRVVSMLSTGGTSRYQIVGNRRAGNNTAQPVFKPSIIAEYNKNMGGVDLADQYTSTYCFLRKTLKWWRKLFFWGLEVSIINAYVLYKACPNTTKKLSHKQFREKLVLDLVKNIRVTAKRGEPSSSDKEQRLNGKLHIITLHPQNKHKDCAVCSNRKVPGGRKEKSYICETCDRKPGLHVGQCFKRYHTMVNYKL